MSPRAIPSPGREWRFCSHCTRRAPLGARVAWWVAEACAGRRRLVGLRWWLLDHAQDVCSHCRGVHSWRSR